MNLIVPPIAETLCTGFELGAEKRIRGKLWRVEWHRSGASLFCDGQPYRVRATQLPDYVEKFIRDVRINHLEPMRALKAKA